jgi:hypothetical protein
MNRWLESLEAGKQEGLKSENHLSFFVFSFFRVFVMNSLILISDI